MSAYELRILNESTGQYIPLAFVQGADGKDAFAEAQAKGYTGTEDEFYSVLANVKGALEELMNWSQQHATDSSIHTTAEEKAVWDGKAAGKHASQHATGGGDSIAPSDIGAANSVHKHSASDIESGTLPVTRGGTGVSSMTGSDYSTFRVRAAAILTGVPTSMENGQIAFVVTPVESSS